MKALSTAVSTRAWFWVAFNAFGMALYFLNSSRLWGAMDFPGAGDGLYWVVFVAPILGVFMLTNVVALIHVVRPRRRHPGIRTAVFAIIAASWLATCMLSVAMIGEPCSSEA
ncbi:MAG: hypothetical protein M3N82_15380 [Pseudomonadota bacterium]|nr:hypothetical protein [Pseudomonadota bacterium]